VGMEEGGQKWNGDERPTFFTVTSWQVDALLSLVPAVPKWLYGMCVNLLSSPSTACKQQSTCIRYKLTYTLQDRAEHANLRSNCPSHWSLRGKNLLQGCMLRKL